MRGATSHAFIFIAMCLAEKQGETARIRPRAITDSEVLVVKRSDLISHVEHALQIDADLARGA